MRPSPAVSRWIVAAVLVLLPLILLHRPVLLGQAFVPADLLRSIAPWRQPVAAAEPSWNVLRYDGIAQYYPWRLLAARTIRAGRLPLWNPYQFGAEGGTPLIANSQSAPLYPLNLLFYLLPTWYAFGLSAALHLLIAAVGMYAFLRGVPVAPFAALLGATTFVLSGPVITWLSLPTFLAVACWLPLLLLLIRHAHAAAGTCAGRLAALGAGAVAGTMLLAGHLQMAFYGLLAAGVYAVWHGGIGLRERRIRPRLWLGALAGATLLALALAAPQALPAVELSRVSHRTGAPSPEGYRAYLSNALPPRNLVTLLAPDFFGHPNAGTYWNANNYAEWAVYVGVLPLVLAVLALALPWRGSAAGERGYFALLGGLALLMALGTPVNALFFFGVPGFSQTGSPARALLLAAFALSALAAVGLDALSKREAVSLPRGALPSLPRGAFPSLPRGALLAAVAVPVLLTAFGASRAAVFAREAVPDIAFGDLMALALPGIGRGVALLAVAAAVLALLSRRAGAASPLAALACVGIAAWDLLGWGIGYNPASPPEAVYPVTPGIRWLQENARGALIAPINRNWSLGSHPPVAAVLPPNALTVYGLHDLAGYDSLFYGAAKRRVRDAGDGEDPSPPENGNMVFVRSPGTAAALGARYLVFAPGAEGSTENDPALRRVYAGTDMVVYENPAGRDWQPPARAYRPASFRTGLFLGLCGVAALAAAGGARAWKRRSS